MRTLLVEVLRFGLSFFRSRASLALELVALPRARRTKTSARRARTPNETAPAYELRSGSLDRPAPALAKVGAGPRHREAGHRDPLASCRLPSVLVVEGPTEGGRPKIAPEVWQAIRQMWLADPTWARPRMHAELAKLGITRPHFAAGRFPRARARHDANFAP